MSGSHEILRIREDARILVERAEDHESELEAIVATADSDVRHAEFALSRCMDVAHASLNDVQCVLDTQLQRVQRSAASVRHLCTSAREQHAAAIRLLRYLDDGSVGSEQRMKEPTSTKAVLVVDDYDEVREVLAAVLENAGFAVRTAANGLEALLTAHQMRPTVIVMDVTMPVLDGIEATRLIKASEGMRDTRVIAYTGDPALGGSRMETLFAAVIQKPATPTDVLAAVRHVASL
jgi:CheY-like chemotaxis protein